MTTAQMTTLMLNMESKDEPNSVLSAKGDKAVFLQKDIVLQTAERMNVVRYSLYLMRKNSGRWLICDIFDLDGYPEPEDVDEEDYTVNPKVYVIPIKFTMDETMLVVGSPFSGDSRSGLVYVFEIDETQWRLSQTIKPIVNNTEEFGRSLDLDEGERTLRVGLNIYLDDELATDIFKLEDGVFKAVGREGPEQSHTGHTGHTESKLTKLIDALKAKL